MSRTVKPPPHPASQLLDPQLPDRMSREWSDWVHEFAKTAQFNTPLTGIATLTATTSVVVSFTTAEPSVAYQIHYDAPDDRRLWTTSKGTASFQINSNISTTVTVGWSLLRR